MPCVAMSGVFDAGLLIFSQKQTATPCDFKRRTAGGAHQTHKTEDTAEDTRHTRHTNGDNSIEKRDSPVERSRRKRPSCGLRGCRRNPEKARRGAPSRIRAGQAGTGASVAVRIGRSGGCGVTVGVGPEADVV